jgi:hypothetical protein
VGVKTAKRLITENTGQNGEIDIPEFQWAMLQYFNTPTMPANMSLAQIVFWSSQDNMSHATHGLKYS